MAACGQSPVGRLLLLDGLSMEWRSVKFSVTGLSGVRR